MESLIIKMSNLKTSDTVVPDTVVPDTVVPDTVVPDTVVPDTVLPDTVVPDTVVPDTVKVPDSVKVPETVVPDTVAPDTVAPDTVAPDTVAKVLDTVVPKSLDYSNILYYELAFSPEDNKKILDFVVKMTNGTIINKGDEIVNEKLIPLVKKLKDGEKALAINDVLYKLNNEFHITVLFTGGKEDEHCDELQKFLDMKFKVSIVKIGVNDSFICIGVSVTVDLPYYGNDVKHITVGLNNFDKSKKVFPKDSFKALMDDNVITNDDEFNVDGILNVILKKN